MKKLLVISVSLAVVTMLISSCCACRKGSPKIGDLESAKWTLIEFNNNPVENSQIILTFDGDKKMIYGEAPCNNFFASYSLFTGDKDNIKIGNAGATRKACPDMDLEMAFTARFASVATLKMEGNHLLMIDNENKLVAVLVKNK